MAIKRTPAFLRCALGGGIVLLLSLSPALANSGRSELAVENPTAPSRQNQDFWTQDFLTGNWGGERDKLKDGGIVFSSQYTLDVLSNLSGGPQGAGRNVGTDGLLDTGVELDTEKLGWWKGGLFHVNSYWTEGADLSNKLKDFNQTSSIGAYDTLKLYEAWYDQHFATGGKDGFVSVRLGQLAIDSEFALSALGATLVNSTFGYPTAVSAFDGHPQYATAGMGGRVLLDTRPDFAPGLQFQAGVYEGNPNGALDGQRHPLNTTGLRYDDQFGMVGAFEAAYRLDPDHGWKGLPGVYKVGGYYHTDGSERPARIDPAGNAVEDNHVIYFMADQMVWRKVDDQGLSLFGAVVTAPSRINLVDFEGTAGLSYKGLIPGRTSDLTALGFAEVTDTNGQANAAFPGTTHSSETVIEATHSFQIAPWFAFQPDFQYIAHPGLNPNAGDAVVVGFRTTVTF